MNKFDSTQLNPALQRELQASGLADKCGCCIQLGEMDEAIATANEIDRRFGQYAEIAVSKHVARALVLKGLAYFQQGNCAEAVACFDDVEKRYGENKWALVSKGNALSQQAKLDPAIACFDEVIKRIGESPDDFSQERVAEALIKKGDVLNRQGKPDEAVACYNEATTRLSRHRFSSHQEWKARELAQLALARKAAVQNVLCSYVFPYGCPDCSPAKSVIVKGVQGADKRVVHTCCGKVWKVSAANWEHTYSDKSRSSYDVRACPKCHQDRAYYFSDSSKRAAGRCKNCGHHTIERDDW